MRVLHRPGPLSIASAVRSCVGMDRPQGAGVPEDTMRRGQNPIRTLSSAIALGSEPKQVEPSIDPGVRQGAPVDHVLTTGVCCQSGPLQVLSMFQKPRVYVKSYGCQMNVYDSGRMTDVMVDAGYDVAETPDEANLIVLNTCHIREKATEKVYSEIGRFKSLKAGGRDVTIAVAGCVAQAEGEEILNRQPLVDLVIGPQSYHRLPDHVARVARGRKIVDAEFPVDDKFASLPLPERRPGRFSTYLTIQEGCDKFCTFCVVPYTRGSEYSRAPQQIREEAEQLVETGIREITLLGQNVNAYRSEGPDGQVWTLARLIHWLAEIPDLARLRFTTSHPRDMSNDLIQAFANCDKLMPYLHLPIQSGSDRILKLMNRRHSVAEYLDSIVRVRDSRPDMLISGDFIVGFPGETEEDFAATLDVVRAVGYGKSYSFRYSARPGTPAAEMDPVEPALAAERLQRLQQRLNEQQETIQKGMIGETVHVLFEREGRNPGQMQGRSEHNHAVHATGPLSHIGQIHPVTITRCGRNSLTGELVAARVEKPQPAGPRQGSMAHGLPDPTGPQSAS